VFSEMDEQQHKNYLAEVAKSAVAKWGISEDAALKLISLSENAMFLVVSGDRRWVLRVHRTGYHSKNGVRSELAWMKALREDAGVETPQAVPGLDGELIQHVVAAPWPEARMVVLFDFIAGTEPQPHDLHYAFRHLGSIAARMHRHAREWKRPAYFERPVWDYESALGPKPNWGHWRQGFALEKGGLETVERADALMRARLSRFGKGPERFGLIHADLRLANLLVADGETKVLDFDDCGFSWYLYDIASSVTFLENRPDLDDLIASWIDGYRTVGILSPEEVAEIPTLIMFRRLIVMGWAGSHPNTDLAREMGDGYTVGTIELAQKYLSQCAL
jgi:Ser/Thr protein kinase RdoA (MazF antagonist)